MSLHGGGPQVNNFEQVTNVGHQISVGGRAGGRAGSRAMGIPGLISGVGEQGHSWGQGWGVLAYTLRSKASWIMVT